MTAPQQGTIMRIPVQTPTQLGQVLRGYRREKGLTQSVVAARAGIGQKTVTKLELDPASSEIATLFLLLSELDLELTLDSRADDFPTRSDKTSDW